MNSNLTYNHVHSSSKPESTIWRPTGGGKVEVPPLLDGVKVQFFGPNKLHCAMQGA